MLNEPGRKKKNPPCWKKRTRTEKCLSIALVLLIVIIAVLLLGKWLRLDGGTTDDTCFTPTCVKTASQVLERVDLSVNPCDDFYMFSCGNFKKNTFLLDYQTSINSFTIVSDLVEKQIRTILGTPISRNDTRPFMLTKSLYQACINTSNIEAHSLPSLKRIIKNVGGWPVVEGDGWNETAFDWQATSYRLMKLGLSFDMFFGFNIEKDPRNSNGSVLFLDQPYTVSFDKLMRKGFNESIVQEYYKYMVEMAVHFGAEPKRRAAIEMRDVIDLDIALTRITIPSEDRRNSSAETNPMTIRSLEKDFPYVHWLHYINTMLHSVKKMSYSNDVIVTVPAYFTKLENLLKHTPKRTLANFMFWKTVKGQIKYLNEDIRNLHLQFSKILYGQSEREPRWKECIGEASGLTAATGSLFVTNFFKKGGKNTMLELVHNIRYQFRETLTHIDWMDGITKQHALEKLKAISSYIAYPDELLDDTKIDSYYQNLTLDRNKYLESMQNLTLFQNHILYAELNRPVNKSDWRNHLFAAVTNAFYDESENSIEFPAAILQGVFFDNDRPQYMNYGAIGYIIGHEITHGFDDQGRQFDKDGNLIDWWRPQTESAFSEKAQCIIDQYGNITVPEIDTQLNGINTQGENIADNGGVKHAYLAYKKYSKDHGRELKLPGLPYTPEQLFWISAGNTWCSVERNEQLKIDVLSEYHSPNSYRVNIPLQNSEYFARDFNCPVGSNMNPVHKCVVW